MQYKKLPVEVKIEEVTEERTIETLEGSQLIRPGQYLVTGVKGELYAFGADKFANYEPVEGREGYFKKKGDVVVDAIQMDFEVEIFRPDWQHKGKAGDYILHAGANDQYVCDKEVFEQIYVKV